MAQLILTQEEIRELRGLFSNDLEGYFEKALRTASWIDVPQLKPRTAKIHGVLMASIQQAIKSLQLLEGKEVNLDKNETKRGEI